MPEGHIRGPSLYSLGNTDCFLNICLKESEQMQKAEKMLRLGMGKKLFRKR